jgi:hypothetical protein
VKLLNVRAYSIRQVGDLAEECPHQFVRHPIGSFTVAPGKPADYFVVVAFTISMPGSYHIDRVKIYYTTRGARHRAAWSARVSRKYCPAELLPSGRADHRCRRVFSGRAGR